MPSPNPFFMHTHKCAKIVWSNGWFNFLISADIFARGNEKCKLAFKELYEQCSQTVTIALAWALCWPMKLDHVCDLMSGNRSYNNNFRPVPAGESSWRQCLKCLQYLDRARRVWQRVCWEITLARNISLQREDWTVSRGNLTYPKLTIVVYRHG